jgi:hypothetical protein
MAAGLSRIGENEIGASKDEKGNPLGKESALSAR